MSEDVPMQYVVVRDPDLQQLAAGAANASRTTSTTLFVSDVNDDNKLLEEIVVKFGVESVSNPTQRALRWDEITKTFNSLSLTLSGKTMTKDQARFWTLCSKVTQKWRKNHFNILLPRSSLILWYTILCLHRGLYGVPSPYERHTTRWVYPELPNFPKHLSLNKTPVPS